MEMVTLKKVGSEFDSLFFEQEKRRLNRMKKEQIFEMLIVGLIRIT